MIRPALLLTLVACAPPDFSSYTLSLTVEREADPLGMFMSAWGKAADDIWLVGGQKGGDGFVLRGEPGAFEPVDLPADTPMLNWVHGRSPDDVWVGGVRGTVLHWDGDAWEDRSVDEMGAVWGVHARTSDDVLVVGGPFFGVGTSFLQRWDGDAFTDVPLPEDLPTQVPLFKTTSFEGDFIVVGGGGWALRLAADGALSRIDTGGGTEDLVTVHVSPGEAPIAVGGDFNTGRIFRFDGTAFVGVADTSSRLNGVHVLPGGSAVAVGNDGIIGTWDAETEAWTASERLTQEVWHAIWVGPDGTTVSVGGNFLTSQPTFEGVVATGNGL